MFECCGVLVVLTACRWVLVVYVASHRVSVSQVVWHQVSAMAAVCRPALAAQVACHPGWARVAMCHRVSAVAEVIYCSSLAGYKWMMWQVPLVEQVLAIQPTMTTQPSWPQRVMGQCFCAWESFDVNCYEGQCEMPSLTEFIVGSELRSSKPFRLNLYSGVAVRP